MGNFTKRSGIYLLAVLLAVCTLFSLALIAGAEEADAGVLGSTASLSATGGETVCYLKNGGTGDGSSADAACGSITEAYG